MTPEAPSLVFQIIERFGFPVGVSICLGAFMWIIGRQIIAELGRLTRAVTLVVLAMQFAPEFHRAASELHEESLSAARRRKEDTTAEEHQRRP